MTVISTGRGVATSSCFRTATSTAWAAYRTPAFSISTILQMPPWRQMPVIRHGADGELTDVVCGYLHSRDPLFDPGLRVFPPVFVVRPPDGPAADWVRANVAYALEQTEVAPSSPGIVMSRLPELLLVEVLRLHLASAPAADRGWLAALNDPVLRPAMSLLHNAPERRWTVSALAREAAVSRSVIDARFREVLGRSPIRYLTEWRMHLAEDLLATTDLGVGVVARRVGYDAEEAFSRAFKRAHDESPSAWRATHMLRLRHDQARVLGQAHRRPDHGADRKTGRFWIESRPPPLRRVDRQLSLVCAPGTPARHRERTRHASWTPSARCSSLD